MSTAHAQASNPDTYTSLTHTCVFYTNKMPLLSFALTDKCHSRMHTSFTHKYMSPKYRYMSTQYMYMSNAHINIHTHARTHMSHKYILTPLAHTHIFVEVHECRFHIRTRHSRVHKYHSRTDVTSSQIFASDTCAHATHAYTFATHAYTYATHATDAHTYATHAYTEPLMRTHATPPNPFQWFLAHKWSHWGKKSQRNRWMPRQSMATYKISL